MTDRAGRWATYQVGYHGRTVSEVAAELDCDCHTVNDAVIAYGRRLVDDPARIGTTTALGLDELLFVKQGRYRTKRWATSSGGAPTRQRTDATTWRCVGVAKFWRGHVPEEPYSGCARHGGPPPGTTPSPHPAGCGPWPPHPHDRRAVQRYLDVGSAEKGGGNVR